MKKVLSLLVLGLLLAGCGSSKETTTVCTRVGSTDGDSAVTELEAKGDKITKATLTEEFDLTALYTEDQIKDNKNVFLENPYEGVDGVTYTSSLDGTVLKAKVVVDYSKADMAELVKEKLVTSDGGETPAYISLEKTTSDASTKCEEK